MKPSRTLSVLLAAAWLLAMPALAAAQETPPEVDELTGLKIAPGWELVRNNCVTCHSARQFLQQKGTRETWRSVIKWMQDRGGLWPLPAETEAAILDYLEAHHGPGREYRRAPIPANLMPPNPYASAARREYEEKLRQGAGPKPPP